MSRAVQAEEQYGRTLQCDGNITSIHSHSWLHLEAGNQFPHIVVGLFVESVTFNKSAGKLFVTSMNILSMSLE